MTTPTQDETLDLVAEVLELNPDIRIGQLMGWMGFLGEAKFDRNIWDLEDEELHALLTTHRATLLARLASTAPQEVRG